MKYFITYQQFGGGGQAIYNMVINEHPSEWVATRNEIVDDKPIYLMGRTVVLFYHEMKDEQELEYILTKEELHEVCKKLARGDIARHEALNFIEEKILMRYNPELTEKKEESQLMDPKDFLEKAKELYPENEGDRAAKKGREYIDKAQRNLGEQVMTEYYEKHVEKSTRGHVPWQYLQPDTKKFWIDRYNKQYNSNIQLTEGDGSKDNPYTSLSDAVEKEGILK